METIIAAVVSGAAGIICSVLAAVSSNAKHAAELESRLEKWQAVTDMQLDELTREVRKHNGFAERLPVIEEKIKVANHRIENLGEERRG